MKVYVVIKHDWNDCLDRLSDYEETSLTVSVCTTIDLAVKEANRVAKEELDDFKAMDGDEFDGWGYEEEVIDRELKKDELLSTEFNKKICWFYLTKTGGCGVEIKEVKLIEES